MKNDNNSAIFYEFWKNRQMISFSFVSFGRPGCGVAFDRKGRCKRAKEVFTQKMLPFLPILSPNATAVAVS